MNAALPYGVAPKRGRERRIALFGGTFDPIHSGHFAVAQAAQRRFHLDEIHFIPTGRPPHKRRLSTTPYVNRYAMVALACVDQPRFIPSLAESGADHCGRDVFYSVDTVRRFKRIFKGTGTQIYFLLGADSFLQIKTWKNYKTLLGSCDFIVASRPGFRIDALRRVIPPELLAQHGVALKRDSHSIALWRTTIHVLDKVSSRVSATDVRKRMDRKKSIRNLVPQRVEDYINKQALYH